MSDDDSEPPFKKRRRVDTLAEKAATPMGTFIYRVCMAAAMALLAAGVGTFTVGLKSRAESIIADSPSMQILVKKADDTEKRAWKLAADLKDEQTESHAKDTELDANLIRISTALNQVSQQQVETGRQMASTTRDLAVLVNHVTDMDKTLDRHERALEKPR